MALKEIIVETQANLRADAANAKAVFSVEFAAGGEPP